MKSMHTTVKSKTMRIKLALFAVIGAIAIIGLSPLHAASGSLPTNDPSNIVSGGIASPTALVSNYNAKNPSDIQPIYNAFGLQTSDLSNFASHAVVGTLNSDGTLTVNGKIVADSAKALGRLGPNAGYKQTTPMTIASKTYYTTPVSYILGFYGLSSTNAFVLMNNDQVQFIAMEACGNPVSVTQPVEKCNMIKSQKVDDHTYNFSADVTAQNGATLQKVVYDFGDKTATVTETNATTVVKHTYASVATDTTYTATVTAYFTYHGQTIVKTEKMCETPIAIPKTPTTPTPSTFLCSALDKPILIDAATRKYSMTAHAQVAGNAVFNNADFNFGDGVSAANIAPTALNEVTTQHEFPDSTATYTIVATLHFTANGVAQSKTCQASLSLTKSTPTPTPTPTPTATVLPSTGPADMIGSGFGIGGIVAAGSYYFRTKRDLLATIFKK